MGSKLLRVYILGGLVLLVIVAGGGFYYAFESSLPDLPPAKQLVVGAPYSEPIPETPKNPEFNIRIKDKHTVIVEWRYLPSLTTHINIFRGKNANAAFAFWESLTLANSDLAAGSRELALLPGENSASYFYYLATFGTNGDPIWTSSSTVATSTSILDTPPPNTDGIPPMITPTSTTTIPPTTTTSTATSTTTSTPPVTSTSTTTSTEPTPTSTSTPPTPTSSNPFSYPPGAILFYSPSGQITGYIVPVDYNFWAQYVNKNIELNWQSMPTATDAIYVYRSTTNTGPWIELLIQYNPPIGAPGSIKIIDETVTQPFYYRMEARQGSQILGIYGPVFLAGLTQ
ncbi:MAG: hypothetical protein AAB631_00685 [Patescibacteria group bacterium]